MSSDNKKGKRRSKVPIPKRKPKRKPKNGNTIKSKGRRVTGAKKSRGSSKSRGQRLT